MMRWLPWAYLTAAFGFIYLPVAALVLFSFQDGSLPVPPFNGPSLRWYAEILGDDDVTAALGHSLLVGVGSSAVAVTLGFLAAYGLARHVVPGSALIRGLLIAPLTVSYLIVGLGLLIVLTRAGIGLSLWTVGAGMWSSTCRWPSRSSTPRWARNSRTPNAPRATSAPTRRA